MTNNVKTIKQMQGLSIFEERKYMQTAEGGRNEALNKLAFCYGQGVGHLHSAQEACDYLITLNDSHANPLPASEAKSTIASGLEAGQAQAWATAEGKEEESPNSSIVDWDNLWEADTSADFLVGDIMERGEQVSIYGAGGAGKSTFARAWALSLANGLPFLDGEAQEAVKVLFLDSENGLKIIQREFQKLGIRPSENLIYMSFPELGALDTEAGAEKFVALLDEHSPDVVVFDSASRFISGEEDSSGPWIQWHRLVMNPLKKRGIASIRLDHPGKDLSRGQRGSSAKTQDVDTIWKFNMDSSGQRIMTCERSRSGNFELGEEIFLNFTKDDKGNSYYKVIDYSVLKKGKSPVDAARNYMIAKGMAIEDSQNTWTNFWKDSGGKELGFTRQDVVNAHKQLKAESLNV